jgi:phosphatidylinositol-4,5-bisphosphate 3-kinase
MRNLLLEKFIVKYFPDSKILQDEEKILMRCILKKKNIKTNKWEEMIMVLSNYYMYLYDLYHIDINIFSQECNNFYLLYPSCVISILCSKFKMCKNIIHQYEFIECVEYKYPANIMCTAQSGIQSHTQDIAMSPSECTNETIDTIETIQNYVTSKYNFCFTKECEFKLWWKNILKITNQYKTFSSKLSRYNTIMMYPLLQFVYNKINICGITQYNIPMFHWDDLIKYTYISNTVDSLLYNKIYLNNSPNYNNYNNYNNNNILRIEDIHIVNEDLIDIDDAQYFVQKMLIAIKKYFYVNIHCKLQIELFSKISKLPLLLKIMESESNIKYIKINVQIPGQKPILIKIVHQNICSSSIIPHILKHDESSVTIEYNVTGITGEIIIKTYLHVVKLCEHDWKKYILKIGPYKEYFLSSTKILSLEYTKECIKKDLQIQFQIINSDNVTLFIEHYDTNKLFPEQLNYSNTNINNKTNKCFMLSTVKKLFYIKILKLNLRDMEIVENIKNKFYRISGYIYHGVNLLATNCTKWINVNLPNNLVWDEILYFNINISNIPLEAHIHIRLDETLTLINNEENIKWNTTDWVNINIFNCDGTIVSSHKCLNMWLLNDDGNGGGNEITITTGQNFDISSKPKILYIEFENTEFPIVHDNYICNKIKLIKNKNSCINDAVKINKYVLTELEKIINTDILYNLSNLEKQFIWCCRHYIKLNYPNYLSKVIISYQSLPIHINMINDFYELLNDWPKINSIFALELLSNRFPDKRIRKFAVNCLKDLDDDELIELIPQLIQVLKYERNHYSYLAKFLLFRAIKSYYIGHRFWWLLMAEIHDSTVEIRFKLLIGMYMNATYLSHDVLKSLDNNKYNSFQFFNLFTENKFPRNIIKKLTSIAIKIKENPSKHENEDLRSMLREINYDLNNSFILPLHPKFEVTGIDINKCRIMNSSTKPLLLTFKTHFNNVIKVIFKHGDDLRVDVLALQLLRIMDKWWKEEGLDLFLEPYNAINTGKNSGMIEVVQNAETIASIQMQYNSFGDKIGAIGVFNENCLIDWLKKYNHPNDMDTVKNRFIYSCAGYCVATYILGVKDRHNDNYMLTSKGNFFHIDFGYFLGNATKFFGISRETTHFVLLPAFVKIMGGLDSKGFGKFIEICCNAFNIVRKKSTCLIILLILMLPAKMPQLQKINQISYVKDSLLLNMSDDDASAKFKELIYDSLNNKLVSINNFIHVLSKKSLVDIASDIFGKNI